MWSVTNSQMNMSGMSDCLFPAYSFTCAGYRHVSFEGCRKYKILHFRYVCFARVLKVMPIKDIRSVRFYDSTDKFPVKDHYLED
jgi:hypothetical protein